MAKEKNLNPSQINPFDALSSSAEKELPQSYDERFENLDLLHILFHP